MASEKMMINQERPSLFFLNEGISEPDHFEELGIGFPYDKRKRGHRIRRDDLFFNYTRIENSPLWEERFRLNMLKIFIEYFCMEKRIPLKDIMSGIERMVIIRVLSHFNGNQRSAAKFLGVKYTTLNEKVKKYNLRIQKKIV